MKYVTQSAHVNDTLLLFASKNDVHEIVDKKLVNWNII